MEGISIVSERKPPYVLCYPNKKNPIGNDWGNFTIDANELAKRLANKPDLNVGVLLGPATGIIDVECDGEAATSHYAELFGDIKTPCWSSKRGVHHLFRYDVRLAEIDSATKKLPTGLEFRLGNGKQAQSIIPPSIVDGVRREWVTSMDECEPAALPEHVIEFLLALPKEAKGEHRDTSSVKASALLIERAQQYAAKLPGVNQGGRNNAAFANAGHLFAFVDEGTNARLGEGQILNLLRLWNDKNDPPLSDDELRQCVVSGMDSKTPRADKVVEAIVDLSDLFGDLPVEQTQLRDDTTKDPSSLMESVSTPQKSENGDKYKPFPSHVFPAPINDYIDAAAKAIDCDPSFIGVPMLSCLARAVGNRNVIELKPGHVEPAIIWTCTIGESGVAKSPGMNKATRFIERIEDEMFDKQKELAEQYKESKLRHSSALKKWQRDIEKDPKLPMPIEPQPPTFERLSVKDCTMEAMAMILSRQKDGLIVMPDELDAWMKGMNQYRSGKGSDLPNWLAIFSGNSIKVDRVKNDGQPIAVKQPCASVTGNIQPATLKDTMTKQHLASGFAARFLFAYPQDKPARWNVREVDPKVTSETAAVFARLFAKEVPNNPVPIRLSSAALDVWLNYTGLHADEMEGMDGHLRAAWAKLQSYAARIALVFGVVKGESEISEATMRAAIELIDWFKHETTRIYRLFSSSADDPQKSLDLIGLAIRHGGKLTPSQLQRAGKRYRGPGVAQNALAGLPASGVGRWDGSTYSMAP